MAIQLAIEAQPGVSRKMLLQPVAGLKRNIILTGISIYPDQQAAASIYDIVQLQVVMALAGLASGFADECRQLAVTAAVCGQKDQLYLLNKMEFAACNQVQSTFTGREMCAHHAGKRAFIAKRQCTITQLTGVRDQFLRMRGASQKAEIANAV